MLCDKCVHKSFCKHYDYMVNNHCLTIDLKECDNYKSKTKQVLEDLSTKTMPNNPNSWAGGSVSNAVSSEHISPKSAYTTTSNDNIALLSGKVYPDLKEEYVPNVSVKEIATPIEISKVVCDRCKKEVPSTEIDNCVECGRPVCRDCGVGALNDGKPEFTCEKCWSGTPDPDPNSIEEVVITYGEEKKEWDIEDFIENEDKKEEKKDERKEQVENGKPIRKSKKK